MLDGAMAWLSPMTDTFLSTTFFNASRPSRIGFPATTATANLTSFVSSWTMFFCSILEPPFCSVEDFFELNVGEFKRIRQFRFHFVGDGIGRNNRIEALFADSDRLEIGFDRSILIFRGSYQKVFVHVPSFRFKYGHTFTNSQ